MNGDLPEIVHVVYTPAFTRVWSYSPEMEIIEQLTSVLQKLRMVWHEIRTQTDGLGRQIDDRLSYFRQI